MNEMQKITNSKLELPWKSRARDILDSRLVQTVGLVSFPIIAFSSYLAGACLGIGYGFWQWGRLQLELSVLYHLSFEHPKEDDYSKKTINNWTFYTNSRRSSIFTAARFHTDKIASFNGADIYLGALPLKKHGDWLESQKVKHVISVVEDWEMEKVPKFMGEAMTPSKWEEKGIAFHHFPQKDRANLSSKTLSEITPIAMRAMQNGESILFHCQAGKGRSAQALAASLGKMTRGLSMEDICENIQKARPQASVSKKRRDNIIQSLHSDFIATSQRIVKKLTSD
ncbi:MAG: dual specificity protein phosphatase family protein [Chlamydiota bacterium]|jgi:protein-tyrosine phosphatase